MTISYQEYESWPGLRASQLKAFAESPHLYKAYIDGEIKHKSSSLEIGTAVHVAVLEPDRFEKEYRMYDGVRRGKKYEEYKEENPGWILLTPGMWEKVHKIQDSVLSKKHLRERIEKCKFEQSYKAKLAGVECKIRVDAHHDSGLYDLKTARKLEFFELDSIKYMYPMALAFYQSVMGKSFGYNPDEYALIAVENNEPYNARIFIYSKDYIKMEKHRIYALLKAWQHCNDIGRFPEIQIQVDITSPSS